MPGDSEGTVTTSSSLAFAKQIGSRFLVHIPIKEGRELDKLEAWDEKQCDAYFLVEIRMVDDGFEMRNFNHELMDNLIESKKIETQKLEPFDRLIMSDGETLMKLIEAYGEKMFEAEGDRFVRIANK